MSKSRHTEAQIIAALKQVEAGRTVDDVVRECGVSGATIYAWEAKYGGLEVSAARKKRRHCVRVGSPRPVLSSANQESALDFAHDVLAAGRNIRVRSVKVADWKMEYNEQRPHSSLGYRTPAEFARVVLTPIYGKDAGSAHL